MSLQSGQLLDRASAPSPALATDRRRFKRVAIPLLGRFMRANKREYPCRLLDISVGGAAILAPTEVPEGENIVVYLDLLGSLEGSVVRPISGGFAMRIRATQHKREKLAAQLTWLINRHELGPGEERRHERLVPKNGASQLKLADGLVVPCQVLDVSISGASVGTGARPAIGEEVVLGKLRAIVVRYHDAGLGVQFVDIQNPAALRRHFDQP